MIGYLGPENSFSYQAASSFYVKEELAPYYSIQRLFKALKDDEVIGIVVPFENAIEGTFYDVFHLLIKEKLHINREIKLHEAISMISKNNDLTKIKYVLSNQHVLNQSRERLDNELIKYKERVTFSTTHALRRLEELDDTYAALTPSNIEMAEYNVLISNMNENVDNQTRYFYVTKSLEVIGFHNRTAILLAVKHDVPGALYDLLHELAIRALSLTKLEAFENHEQPGINQFYIEFEGNLESEIIVEALEILRYKSRFFTIVGSFYSKK